MLLSTIYLLQSCEKHEDYNVPDNLRINDFVWKGLNLYYLWQPFVPYLDDERFGSQQELNGFLSGYSDPAVLFNNLLIDESLDRFSVIFSNYNTLEGLLSGTTKNNGVDYGLRYKSGSNTEIFGWVRYILPNSDASGKDIHRGDIFYAVNGESLTINNYKSLLANDTYTLNLADYDSGNITPNGETVTLTKTIYSENPVLISQVINSGDNKIGYMVYNGFYPNYESQLNNAFGQLKSEGVTDLILDLRYNSGGSIATASRLASMITGQFDGQLLGKEQWNAKAQAHLEGLNQDDLINKFTAKLGNNATISSLNLMRVYVLTSRSTASASELIINCLEPYIDVIQIGDVTTGKNVGSITLYDSADFKPEGRTSRHTYAMQPIVLKIVNKDGFGDYTNGLNPDYALIEDLGNLDVLGNETEPLLSTAIGIITSDGRLVRQNPDKIFKHFKDLKTINRQDQMYVEQTPR